jgi:hypothetical protein
MSDTTQPAPETDEKNSRGLGSYVVWAFVAVIVYVLSSGPAIRFTEKSGKPSPIIELIYRPLGWAYGKTSLWKPLGLYWRLWAPRAFDKNGKYYD